jgi:hypothetical protein
MQQPNDFVDVVRPNQFGTHYVFGLPLTAFASQQDLNSTLTQLGNTQNSLAQLSNTLGQLSHTQNQINFAKSFVSLSFP